MTTEPTWRKSSRSSGNETCVEVAYTHNLVRDSKNPTGPTLHVDLKKFIAAVQDGHCDR